MISIKAKVIECFFPEAISVNVNYIMFFDEWYDSFIYQFYQHFTKAVQQTYRTIIFR